MSPPEPDGLDELTDDELLEVAVDDAGVFAALIRERRQQLITDEPVATQADEMVAASMCVEILANRLAGAEPTIPPELSPGLAHQALTVDPREGLIGTTRWLRLQMEAVRRVDGITAAELDAADVDDLIEQLRGGGS